jgi:hypothetical protein
MWSVLALLGIGGWLAVTLSERRHHASVPTCAQKARLPLGNGTAWLVSLFFASDNFLFYALLSWTSPMYREAGLSATIAGLILASFTAAFMVANPIFGWLSKSHDRRGWLAVCAVLGLAGLVPTALAPGLAPFLFIPLCAFGLGGAFTLGMTLPLDNTDSVDEANVWNAFALTVGYLIAAVGPLGVMAARRGVRGDAVPYPIPTSTPAQSVMTDDVVSVSERSRRHGGEGDAPRGPTGPARARGRGDRISPFAAAHESESGPSETCGSGRMSGLRKNRPR